MMKLNDEGLGNKKIWQDNAVELPLFDRATVCKKTKDSPTWIHFGPGNIFRAFIAALQQTLLDNGLTDTGIITAAPNGRDIIDKIYEKHDNLSLLVTMYPDQSTRKKVIASITESLGSQLGTADWLRLQEIFRAPSLQIVSFTITEKGYKLQGSDGNYLPEVLLDMSAGPAKAQSFMARVTSLLYERYLSGAQPISLLSMDNCSHNGLILQAAVEAIGASWVTAGFVETGFKEYLSDKVAYPCSMIDKITPRPSEQVRDDLLTAGFENMDFVASARGGSYAPFVNAEKTEYLVVEDIFPNGRPPLEKAGVIFTDRETVDRVERMKVCTCLNPLHTALAVFGCLLGYTLIADEMANPQLKKLVEKIGLLEGMKVVTDPGVLNPAAFIEECLNQRFPNPAIPDTPQRIACDTSQKVGVRFGETIKAYQAATDLSAAELEYIPLAIAGWCRYLLGLDDEGNTFSVSPDPLLEKLQGYLTGIHLGQAGDVHAALLPILSDVKIFGIDLYEAGLGQKIERYFAELCAGKKAVAKTLIKYTV